MPIPKFVHYRVDPADPDRRNLSHHDVFLMRFGMAGFWWAVSGAGGAHDRLSDSGGFSRASWPTGP
jgi:hypothetical protein